jgi:nucleoside-diphosphate-sugar epimerase
MRKKILITGSSSYVGNTFAKWMSNFGGSYTIEKVSTRNEEWRNKDFSQYDIILNVAGIAHVEAKKSMETLYYKVNRDLSIDIAKKAKQEGVKQYIYMSSMIVYGNSFGKKLNQTKLITNDTTPEPVNFYGDSKLQAEKGILSLQSPEFSVSIIRAPMIYSNEAKGNFPKLIKFAEILPIFPKIDNQRSMIYIDNLCEFIRLLIEHKSCGVFFPQDKEYVNTSDIVYKIALEKGRYIKLTKLFNPLLGVASLFIKSINKSFGSYIYDKEMSAYFNYKYCVVDYEKSIKLICGKKI